MGAQVARWRASARCSRSVTSYGIVRANFPDGVLASDSSTPARFGLYLAQLGKRQPVWQHMRFGGHCRNWTDRPDGVADRAVSAMPCRTPLIQLVGLRGSIFLLPFVLLGARLTGDDVYKLALWLSLRNLAAGALAVVQFVVGVEQFFPHNAVTDIIYRSKDLANYTAYRIPSSFSNAHAYAGDDGHDDRAHCRRMGAGPHTANGRAS